MADEKDVKKKEDLDLEKPDEMPVEKADEKKTQKASGTRLLQWIIMAAAVAVCAGGGLTIGRLFADFRSTATSNPSQQDEPGPLKQLKRNGPAKDQRVWYYDLDPVVANLNEPGVRRYVRVAVILVVDPQVDRKKGTAFLDEKKPLLTNYLTIYLASLTLEDIRGDKNLRRIQSQLLDAFNEKLFPDAKPQIKHILFKEFAVQ
ncbi:MAG: flagellar basal body-associated FliL family protein [Planctomycetota bacterium]|jgi:flagellar basal body-associated protein FliL